jgi:CheY-like chemotaxis protein
VRRAEFQIEIFAARLRAGGDAGGIAEFGKMLDILLVDDDALMRELIAEWLSEAGYRVRQAETGTAALQMLRSRPAAMLITDMDMPGHDGAQTIGEARRVVPGLAVIAISGGDRDGKQDWASKARNQGAAMTLAKPFVREDLLAAVVKVIAGDDFGAAHT